VQDIESGIFIPVLSQVVADEVYPAPRKVLEMYQKLLTYEHEFVEVTDDALQLTEAYTSHAILPENYFNDLLHIALATIAEVDILVSWNFKHIVRYDKIKLFNAVHFELNYKQLQIFSPREVTIYGNENN
jgi:hypothetical protein